MSFSEAVPQKRNIAARQMKLKNVGYRVLHINIQILLLETVSYNNT